MTGASSQAETATSTAIEGEESSPRGFSPINTQEEFDKAIKARLARENSKAEERFKQTHADVFEKAKQFDALEEANKTELQRAQEQLASVTKELEDFRHREELNSWAAEVSKDTGVPANLLRGNTKEEMQSHAEQLKEFVSPAAPVVTGEGTKPITSSSPGGDPIRDLINSRQ